MAGTNWYRATLGVLFGLFFIANAAYLHRVPGLMGDEASEGENVYLLLDAKQLVITGERSYIGPLIDYIRVPFVLLLGYSAWPLRLLVFLFSLATFWLVVVTTRRLWGEDVGLVGAVALLFSPVYLLEQRMGWAITLFPFFVFLMLYLLTLPGGSLGKRHASLLAGLAAGLGLHNHVLFLPTLVAVMAGWLLAMVGKRRFREIWSFWPAAVGFMAGFGTQLAVMLLNRSDFQDSLQAVDLYGDRIRDLPALLPMVVSSSSYVARYTGAEFTPSTFMWVTAVVTGLVVLALILPKRRGMSWVWLASLAVLLFVLLYMVFQFSLRYFVTFVLGVWLLAGIGLGSVLVRLFRKQALLLSASVSIGLAVLLLVWVSVTTLVPYLRTGGSTGEFSLGNRNDSAAALVDTRPLIECLRGAGPVYAENIHIYNRLRYLGHNPNYDLEVIDTNESKKRAEWIVSYRPESEDQRDVGFEKCPDLKHWRVVARDRG